MAMTSPPSAARSIVVREVGERVDVVVAEGRHGSPDRLGLEEGAQPVDLEQVRHAQLGHEVPAMRVVHDLPLALESLQRLAQRHPADAVALGQQLLDDLVARPEVAGEDVRPQGRQHRVLGRRPSLGRSRLGQPEQCQHSRAILVDQRRARVR